MRRIVTAITAAARALSLVAQARPAVAAPGFDSSYAGESAFLTLRPDESGSFTVFFCTVVFANTGTTTWTRGTSTQVDLYACLNNNITCDAVPRESAWNPGSWLSSPRRAARFQMTAAPRANGYSRGSSQSRLAGRVHPVGYFQYATAPSELRLRGEAW